MVTLFRVTSLTYQRITLINYQQPINCCFLFNPLQLIWYGDNTPLFLFYFDLRTKSKFPIMRNETMTSGNSLLTPTQRELQTENSRHRHRRPRHGQQIEPKQADRQTITLKPTADWLKGTQVSGLIMRLHCRRASNGKHNAQQTNWASRSRSRSRSLSRCDLSQCPTACDTHRENPGLGYSSMMMVMRCLCKIRRTHWAGNWNRSAQGRSVQGFSRT